MQYIMLLNVYTYIIMNMWQQDFSQTPFRINRRFVFSAMYLKQPHLLRVSVNYYYSYNIHVAQTGMYRVCKSLLIAHLCITNDCIISQHLHYDYVCQKLISILIEDGIQNWRCCLRGFLIVNCESIGWEFVTNIVV